MNIEIGMAEATTSSESPSENLSASSDGNTVELGGRNEVDERGMEGVQLARQLLNVGISGSELVVGAASPAVNLRHHRPSFLREWPREEVEWRATFGVLHYEGRTRPEKHSGHCQMPKMQSPVEATPSRFCILRKTQPHHNKLHSISHVNIDSVSKLMSKHNKSSQVHK